MIDPNKPFNYGASYVSNAIKAANVQETIVAAASNVRGMIVWAADFWEAQTNGGNTVILAKTSAPASVVDGDVIVPANTYSIYTANGVTGWLARPIFIPAGKGLYYITDATCARAMRRALYTLL